MSKTTTVAQQDQRRSHNELIAGFDQWPDEALVDVPVVGALTGSGESTVWSRVKNDPDHPKPIKLSARCTRFRVGDIRRYIRLKAGELVAA